MKYKISLMPLSFKGKQISQCNLAPTFVIWLMFEIILRKHFTCTMADLTTHNLLIAYY